MGPWADLPGELLVSIAHEEALSLRDHLCLRGVCTAWRSVLVPLRLFPSILAIADDGARASAVSESMQRPLHLCALSQSSRIKIRRTSRIIGSSNGLFTVAGEEPGTPMFLLNPLSGEETEISLHPRMSRLCARKIVLTPGPTPDDGYTAVAIFYGMHSKVEAKYFAYAKVGGASEWAMVHGGVSAGELVDLVHDADGGKVYCLDSLGDVHVLHVADRRQGFRRLLAEKSSLPFIPAVVFGAPYDRVSQRTSAKNLFLCGGGIYQVWRNCGITTHMPLPSGGRFTMSDREIFVLRYRSGRWPCWDLVKDLGGYSIFIGKNSPVVVPAGTIAGVRR